MKKFSTFFAVVIAVLVMASCSVTRPRRVETLFLDFRPYTETGFYLSPNPYTLPHDVLGELSINIYPGIFKNGSSERQKMHISSPFKDGIYSKGSENRKFVDATYNKLDSKHKENISSDELLDIAVSYAKSLGSDGISNLKISVIYHTYNIGNTLYSELDYYKISGSCILRK